MARNGGLELVFGIIGGRWPTSSRSNVEEKTSENKLHVPAP